MAPNPLPASLLADVRTAWPDAPEDTVTDLWAWLLIGMPRALLVESLTEDDVSQEVAEHAADTLIAARRAQLEAADAADEAGAPASAWDEALMALAEVDILVAENFADCGTCLAAEIQDEQPEDDPWLGYIGYHQQDAARLVLSGETYLSFGAFPERFFTADQWEAMTADDRNGRMDEISVTLMRTSWSRSCRSTGWR